MASSINWERIKEEINRKDWERVSERWETRKVSIGLTREIRPGAKAGSDQEEEFLSQLDDEAGRYGMFVDRDEMDPGHLYIAQGRLRNIDRSSAFAAGVDSLDDSGDDAGDESGDDSEAPKGNGRADEDDSADLEAND